MARKSTLASVWTNLQIEREIVRKVIEETTRPDGGTNKTRRWLREGHERVWVSVSCDWSKLQGLLHAAARNKSGRAQDGAFSAIVERREKID